MAVMNIWLEMARSQFQADDPDVGGKGDSRSGRRCQRHTNWVDRVAVVNTLGIGCEAVEEQ